MPNQKNPNEVSSGDTHNQDNNNNNNSNRFQGSFFNRSTIRVEPKTIRKKSMLKINSILLT